MSLTGKWNDFGPTCCWASCSSTLTPGMKSDISAKDPPAINPEITCVESEFKFVQCTAMTMEGSGAITSSLQGFNVSTTSNVYSVATLVTDLHAGLVVVLPDVLQDGVQALQRGGGEHLGPQLVVEDVQLVSHVIQLPPHLGVAGNCRKHCERASIELYTRERSLSRKHSSNQYKLKSDPSPFEMTKQEYLKYFCKSVSHSLCYVLNLYVLIVETNTCSLKV